MSLSKVYHNKRFLPETHPHLVTFYSPRNEIPVGEVKAGSHVKRWWKLPCGHEFSRAVQYFTRSQSCSVCINKAIVVGVNDLESTHPELVKAHWSPLNDISPREVTCGSVKKVVYRCSKGHGVLRQVKLIVSTPEACAICTPRFDGASKRGGTYKKKMNATTLLSEKHPELEAFYAVENKYSFAVLPHPCFVQAKWNLPCGHSIKREVNYFLKSQSCSVCANKQLLTGFNDLATVAPWNLPHLDENYYDCDGTSILAGPTSLIRVLCGKCKSSTNHPAASKNEPLCWDCSCLVSSGELSLRNFLSSLSLVVANDRTLLKGKELDVLIPDSKLAVEFNGTYWHSDAVMEENLGMSAEEYHRRKRDTAAKAGVKLFFVWEDDWNLRRGKVEGELRILVATGTSSSPLLTTLSKG